MTFRPHIEYTKWEGESPTALEVDRMSYIVFKDAYGHIGHLPKTLTRQIGFSDCVPTPTPVHLKRKSFSRVAHPSTLRVPLGKGHRPKQGGKERSGLIGRLSLIATLRVVAYRMIHVAPTVDLCYI